MTGHGVGHRSYEDEPTDPVEAMDRGFAQSVSDELRQLNSNVPESKLNREEAARPEEAPREDEVLRDLDEPGEAEPSALDALKAMAARGKEVRAAAKSSGPADAFAALLGRVRERVAEDQLIKDDRRKAAGVDAGGLTPAQREALRAKVLKWEAEREWTPVACLLVLEHQVCSGCGDELCSVYGLFERQTRRLDAAAKVEGKLPSERLVRWCPEDLNEPGLKDLPRQVTYRQRNVSTCYECRNKGGFVETIIDWENVK